MTLTAVIRKDRHAWRAEQVERCMVCGYDGYALPLQVHEICRRSQSVRAQHRCNWLLLCQACHDLMGSEEWPMTRQLVLKAIRDRANFDLAEWIRIRGRGPNEITFEDLFWCAIGGAEWAR
jgi:5-methylcytosine-specific restriction endonuclease McrA